VLRVTDPRSCTIGICQGAFPGRYIDPVAELVYEVVPAVLKEQGKAKTGPNVDAISGALQYLFMACVNFDFLNTVLFGCRASLGVTANLVWGVPGSADRAAKSLSTAHVGAGRRRARQVAAGNTSE